MSFLLLAACQGGLRTPLGTGDLAEAGEVKRIPQGHIVRCHRENSGEPRPLTHQGSLLLLTCAGTVPPQARGRGQEPLFGPGGC